MNKTIKFLCVIVFTILIVIFCKIDVKAATANLSASSTSIKLGETVTITTTINGASWDIKLSGAISEGYADTTDDAENGTKTYTYTYQPTSAGTFTINLNGNITDSSANISVTVEDHISITVIEPETPTTPPEEPSSNNENNSSNGNNSSSNNTNNNSNNNNSNNNTNNNNTNTSTTKEKSSEARLSNLGIEPNDFSGFKSNTYEYNVEVPNNVDKVKVYAETRDSKATIKSGTGNVNLNEGENKIEIVVVAEDGKTTKTYKLNITRKTEEEPKEPETESTESTSTTEPLTEATNDEKIGLSSLTISGLNINPKFSNTTYEYTVGLTQDLSSIEIEAKANNTNATVEIFGNENLQQGENIITIIVSQADSEETATYLITVNKNVVIENEVAVNWFNPSTWGTKQYILVGLLVFLIIVVIISIILKIKLIEEEDDDEIEFPGVEELDKALTEHQELTGNEDKDENIVERRQKVKKLFEESNENNKNSKNNDNYDNTNNNMNTKEKVNKLFENDEETTPNKKKGKHF